MFKRLVISILAVVMGLLGTIVSIGPAQAVEAGQDICNSRGSTGRMTWSTVAGGTRTYRLLANGACINVSSRDVPSFRVSFIGERWKVANNGGAYGGWHNVSDGHLYTPASNDVNWYRVEG